MLINFKQAQQRQFDAIAKQICHMPEQFINFEHIGDVYVATWLAQFPKVTQLMVSGLDDGAEYYCIKLTYLAQYLQIDYGHDIQLVWCDRLGQKHQF